MNTEIKIDEILDKDLYYKQLTGDRIINITGEGGSGKSTLANEYKNDPNYMVIDYDLILLNPEVGTIEYKLKQMIIDKYGDSLFQNINNVGIEQVKINFTKMYNEVINYLNENVLKNEDKTVILDGTQIRFISDPSMIKGEFVALRPSLQTCVSQSVNRYIENNPTATPEQIESYSKKRSDILHKLNPMMNELLVSVEKLPDFKNPKIEFDDVAIQSYLNGTSKKYLELINKEYGPFMSKEKLDFLNKVISKKCVFVEKNGTEYLKNQTDEIKKLNLSNFERLEEFRNLDIPLAHGGRVYEDNIIHFYPSRVLAKNRKLSTEELQQECDEVLIHELLHFFIRPEKLNIDKEPQLKRINNFTTEGLVDMCARDIQMKYGLFPKYKSDYGPNVIFIREALNNIPNVNDRMKLVFNGTVEQIYSKTTTKEYDSKKHFIESRKKNTNFDKLILNISTVYGYKNEKDDETKSWQRFFYNYSANYPNKDVSVREINDNGKVLFPEKYSSVKKEIDKYNEKKTVKTTKKKSFTWKNDTEVKTYSQIKQKNQIIKQKKAQQKQMNKAKVKTLTPPKQSGNGSKAFTNVITLSLIVSFAFALSFMVAYIFLIK